MTRDDQPGFLARFDDTCPRCPEPILAGQRVTHDRHRRLIHIGCASGQDDQ